jgi:Fe2+ or Zn2+ uptake regulation protein
MSAKWRLPELLERESITAYRLHKELNERGIKATPNTIYRWAKELPSYVTLDLLVGIVETLRALTGRPITISDLIEVE